MLKFGNNIINSFLLKLETLVRRQNNVKIREFETEIDLIAKWNTLYIVTR